MTKIRIENKALTGFPTFEKKVRFRVSKTRNGSSSGFGFSFRKRFGSGLGFQFRKSYVFSDRFVKFGQHNINFLYAADETDLKEIMKKNEFETIKGSFFEPSIETGRRSGYGSLPQKGSVISVKKIEVRGSAPMT